MRNSLGHGKAFSFQAILLYLATAVSLSACNPQGDISTIEAGFHPGLVSAQHNTFSNVWDFNTNASYAYDSSKIQFTGGVCSLKGTDQIDDDNSASGFGGGSLSGAAFWDSTNTFLKLGSGTSDSQLSSSWTPAWSNIVVYWNLNETSGTTFADSAPSGSNLGLTSGGLSLGTPGKFGSAVTFNGTSGEIRSSDSYTDPNNFTLNAWFKTTTTSGGTIIGLNGSGHADRMIYMTDGGRLIYALYPGSVQIITTSGTYNDGTWHNVASTLSSSGMKLYVDGALAGELSNVTSGENYSGEWSIGGGFTGNWPSAPTSTFLNGTMDEVAVWDIGLTATAISEMYEHQMAAHSGTISSRVIDARQTGMNWTTLGWKTTLPFFKELPDYASGAIHNESSTDYASLVGSTGTVGDNNLMSGIVGLWHLDEGAGISGPNSVKDSSGSMKNGTPSGTFAAGKIGKFNGALTFDGSTNSILTPLVTAQANDLTVSMWVSENLTGQGCQAAMFSSGANSGFALTVNRTCADPTRLWLRFAAFGFADTGYNFVDSNWHHIVYNLSPTDVSNVYVDGALIYSQSPGAPGGGNTSSSIGALAWTASTSIQPFNGSIDEVAVWNRSLDPKEILQLYRRGANRVKHQVRICTTSDCSDDASGANWKGPDGTNQTYFSELNNNSVPLAMSGAVKATPPSMLFSAFTNPVGPSRYFQYRTILESDDTGTGCNYGSGATWCSPELKSVTVDPVHYDSSSPTVVGHTGVSFYSLANFTQTLGSSCAGGIGYNLGVGSSYSSAVWYWWDSTANSGTGAWSASDGTVTKSNDAATINSHAPTFGTQVSTGTVYFKAFLKSSGSTACELDQLDLGGQQ